MSAPDLETFLQNLQDTCNEAHEIASLDMRLFPARSREGTDTMPRWTYFGFPLDEVGDLFHEKCLCVHPECEERTRHYTLRQVEEGGAAVFFACDTHQRAAAFLSSPTLFLMREAERHLAMQFEGLWLALSQEARLDGIERLIAWVTARLLF